MSWQKLAERGYWVEGCAENLGIEHVQSMLFSETEQGEARSGGKRSIEGLHPEAWTVLTHEDAGEGVVTYRVTPSPQEAEGLVEATHVFWGSGSQFLRLKHLASNAKFHACGAGKTAEMLRTHGITPDIFPNRKEWKKAVSL
jgi:hypothetical protein